MMKIIYDENYKNNKHLTYEYQYLYDEKEVLLTGVKKRIKLEHAVCVVDYPNIIMAQNCYLNVSKEVNRIYNGLLWYGLELEDNGWLNQIKTSNETIKLSKYDDIENRQ